MKKTVTVLVVIAAVALILRFYDLSLWPVFADEAIYIRWSQIMAAEPTLRFLPMIDGKQPLYMWILMTFVDKFADPLFAGRAISAASGALSIIGIFAISYQLFNNTKTSLLASFLWALSPYALFFERMALVDALLCMMIIWSFNFILLAVRSLRTDAAMVAGFFAGGALLTKSPGVFALLLYPAAALPAILPVKQKKKTIRRLVKIAGLFTITALISFVIYSILRLGPNFHMLSARTLDYVFPLSHIFSSPFVPLYQNLLSALAWIAKMGTVSIIFLFIIGSLTSYKIHKYETIFLMIWVFFPLLIQAEYAKVFTARYIFYLLPPIYILAAQAYVTMNRNIQKLVYFLLGLFIFQALNFNRLLLTDPMSTPIPANERSGYLGEWSSGIGIKDIAVYIEDRHASNPAQKIVVGTEGAFGTLPDGLQIYLHDVPNVLVVGLGFNYESLPEALINSYKADDEVYFVVNRSRLNFDPADNGLELIASYRKAPRQPGTHEYVSFGPVEELLFYRVTNLPRT